MVCDGNVTTRVELSALLTVAFSNPTRTKFLSIKKNDSDALLNARPKISSIFFLCLVRTVGRNLKHFPPYFCLYWCIIYFFAKAISSRHFYTTHFIRRSLFWPQNFHSQLTLIAHHTPSREQIVRESSNTETIWFWEKYIVHSLGMGRWIHAHPCYSRYPILGDRSDFFCLVGTHTSITVSREERNRGFCKMRQLMLYVCMTEVERKKNFFSFLRRFLPVRYRNYWKIEFSSFGPKMHRGKWSPKIASTDDVDNDRRQTIGRSELFQI